MRRNSRESTRTQRVALLTFRPLVPDRDAAVAIAGLLCRHCLDAIRFGNLQSVRHMHISRWEGPRLRCSFNLCPTLLYRCAEDLSVLSFGPVFTESVCERRITVENKGRRQQVTSLQNTEKHIHSRNARQSKRKPLRGGVNCECILSGVCTLSPSDQLKSTFTKTVCTFQLEVVSWLTDVEGDAIGCHVHRNLVRCGLRQGDEFGEIQVFAPFRNASLGTKSGAVKSCRRMWLLQALMWINETVKEKQMIAAAKVKAQQKKDAQAAGAGGGRGEGREKTSSIFGTVEPVFTISPPVWHHRRPFAFDRQRARAPSVSTFLLPYSP